MNKLRNYADAFAAASSVVPRYASRNRQWAKRRPSQLSGGASRRWLPALAGTLSLAALATPSSAEHFWFGGPNNASTSGSDIVYQETLWPYWAQTTFYNRWETSYVGPTPEWTYGYGGLSVSVASQTTGSQPIYNGQTFWPASPDVLYAVPEWWYPVGLSDAPQIGEGAKGKIEGNLVAPYTTDVWYPAVMRVWQPTDPNQSGTSKVGQWVKDGVTGKWEHFGTFTLPWVATGLSSIGGFLEDTHYQNMQPRRMDFRNLYYHLSGSWSPAVTFHPSMRQTGEKGLSGLKSNGTACFFETCSDPNYSGNMSNSGPNAAPTYTLSTPSTPTFDQPSVTGVSATVSAGKLNVQWTVPATSSPQFSYTIKVYPTSNTSGTPSQTVTEIQPDAYSKTFATSVTSPTVVLTVTDVFNQTTPPVTVTAQSASLPTIAGLTTADIGAVGVAGNDVALQGGGCIITGGGSDIYWNADAFRFGYVPMTGDCTVTTRVNSQDATDPWAKAGVMIRSSLAADAAHASVFVTPGNGMVFQYRTSNGGQSGNVAVLNPGTCPDIWLRMVRSGNTFTAWTSTDNANWTIVGTQTISMGTSVYAGLAVTAHNNGLASSALFPTAFVTPGAALSGYHVVVSKSSTLCVNDPANSGSPGTAMIQWTTGTDANEVWKFILNPDGKYTLVNKTSGLVLNASGSIVDQQYWSSGTANQEWSLIPQAGGYFELQNVGTGLVLDDPNTYVNGVRQLDLKSWTGGDNQLWSLRNVPPVTLYSLGGPNIWSWWWQGTVTMMLYGTDSIQDPVTGTYYTVDGGSQQTYSGPFKLSDGIHTVTFQSVDAAGATEATNSQTIKVDGTPPVTTASVSGSTVTLTATDNASGVYQTYYQVDGGSWQAYTGQFTVPSGSSHSVGYSSNDNANNHEPNQYITVP